MRWFPDSAGARETRARLREYNDCNLPAGKEDGGQFGANADPRCAGGGNPAAGAAGRASAWGPSSSPRLSDATPSASAARKRFETNSNVMPGDTERFRALKARWATVNDQLLDVLDQPDSDEARALTEELKAIVKEMYGLKADPGGEAGVKLPGGPRDVVIVGAGPAGLSAAVNGGVEGLDTLLIDGNPVPGGQAKHSSRIENLAGFNIGVEGAHLAEMMQDHAERVGAEMMFGVRVTGIEFDADTEIKTLTLSNGETVQARSVILAGGVAFRSLEFDGSDHPNVVTADAQFLKHHARGKDVTIIGGSNGAAQAALGVARTARHVTVVSRSALEKGMSDYQISALQNHPQITVIEGDEIASFRNGTVTTKQGRTLTSEYVGTFVGGGPDTKWLPPSIATDRGRIKVNQTLETNIPGVYAVGDIRMGGAGRVGAAVGEGQMAVKFAWPYLYKGVE